MALDKRFKAIYRYAQISAQKVRPFADLIRGKFADEAFEILSCYPNRGARMLEKVLHSAVHNAMDQQRGGRMENIEILDVRVDGGPVQRRWRPKARGSSMPYMKRTAHISIEVG